MDYFFPVILISKIRLTIIGNCQRIKTRIVENKSGGVVKKEIRSPAISRISIAFHQLFLSIFHLVANTENRNGRENSVNKIEKY